jgi:vWA-MoxR associated protein C-terminal domain/vWA-MoxR associated protein middle region 0/Effector-associated domain 2
MSACQRDGPGLLLEVAHGATPEWCLVNEEFQYKRELLEAFQALDCMQARQIRDTFVVELEHELGRPLNFRRHDVVRYDLWELIGTCLTNPEEGALERLVTIVRTFEGDSHQMVRIIALVGHGPPVPAPPPGQPSLDEVLNRVEAADLAAATRAAAGPLGPPPGVSLTDRSGLVNALGSSSSMPGAPPPLLVFLVQLAARLDGPLAAELATWIDRIAGELGVPAAELDQIRAGPVPVETGPARSFVVVELREDGPRPDRYLMSVWLQHDNGYGRALHVNDDQPLPLNLLPGQLDGVLLELAEEALEEIGDITVEFVLPRELLNHSVDQWPIVLTGLDQEIGTVYPVVVRSLERIRNPMFRARWQRRWRQLRAFGGAARADLVQWLHWGNADHRTALAQVLALGEESPVCLIVSFSAEAGSLPTAITAGLLAGVPVMLWCRDGRCAARFEADIPQQMYARPLLDLPALVLRLRQEATRPGHVAEHVGRHLSLLWDDPDRIPPDNPLEAPAPA